MTQYDRDAYMDAFEYFLNAYLIPPLIFQHDLQLYPEANFGASTIHYSICTLLLYAHNGHGKNHQLDSCMIFECIRDSLMKRY